MRLIELHIKNNATLREAQLVEAAFNVVFIEGYSVTHPLCVLLRQYGIPDEAFFSDDGD